MAVFITPSDLGCLPTDWIARFREAAMKGKSGELFNLLEEIQDAHGHVANALAEIARNYQFSKIVALIEKGNSHE